MNSRQAALKILEKCFSGETLSGQLDELLRRGDMKSEDIALASNISMGVIQNYRLLDHYIASFSNIPFKKIHPKVRQILRIGLYQIIFLSRVPDFAAINETAGLCSGSIAHTRGFVNAILRTVSNEKDRLPDIKYGSLSELLSKKYSHPDYFVDMLISEYGPENAEAILKADNEKPDLSVFVNVFRTDSNEFSKLLSEHLIEFSRNSVFGAGFLLPSMPPAQIPGYADGLFYVQDQSAHFISTLFYGKKDISILDCCSAPGGKSISCAMACRGSCRITACDVSEYKTALIKESVERLGLDCIETSVCDASVFTPAFEASFDAVIADVPCSGLGIIRKHPEIRLKSADSISGLTKIQQSILRNVCRYVRPGGMLVYSTCSIDPAENEDQIRAFLLENSDFAPMEHEYGGLKLEGGCRTFLPGIDGGDGFFTAVMRRK